MESVPETNISFNFYYDARQNSKYNFIILKQLTLFLLLFLTLKAGIWSCSVKLLFNCPPQVFF